MSQENTTSQLSRSRKLWPPSPIQILGLAVLATFMVIQLTLTVRNETMWPFSPYNMFNYIPGPLQSRYVVVLIEDDGHRQEVDPGNAVPIEFFRANRLFTEVFAKGDPPVGRTRPDADLVAGALLSRLNAGGWHAFDETWPAATPNTGARFVDLEIHQRLSRVDGVNAEAVVRDRILYSGLGDRP